MSFFTDKEEKLQQELESWVDTPFRHKQGIKGTGVDCIHLVARVLESFGFGPFRIPDYARDWHMHRTSGMLMNEVAAQIPNTSEVSIDDVKNGDIVFYHVGKDTAHAGIYFGGYIYHAITGIGVVKIRWEQALKFRNATYAVAKVMRIN